MGARRRLVTVTALLTVGVAVVSTSCRTKQEVPPDNQKPPDRLAPNEVVEGKEVAFGLPLPRAARVASRWERKVLVTSPLSPEELANFVRARVKDGKLTAGTGSTQLADVVPLHEPTRRLNIEVRVSRSNDGARSEMMIQDATPIAAEPGLTDEERWRKAGFTKDGKVADPTRLQ